MKLRPAKTTVSKRNAAANQFRRDAKLDEGALMRIVFGFCTGAPVDGIAERAGISAKTGRALVLRLRARLAQPKFNRWHAAFQKWPRATSPDQEFLVREDFLDALGACHGNTTCFRNFALGNRKTRLCRACPLPGRFTETALEEALGVVDAVRAFYDGLGIRGEATTDASSIFYLRLIHTTTVATALGASRRPDGRLVRPEQPGFLSVWALLDLLLFDLADRPL